MNWISEVGNSVIIISILKNSKNVNPNKIISILEDNSGILWIGTQELGLIKLNKENRTIQKLYDERWITGRLYSWNS